MHALIHKQANQMKCYLYSQQFAVTYVFRLIFLGKILFHFIAMRYGMLVGLVSVDLFSYGQDDHSPPTIAGRNVRVFITHHLSYCPVCITDSTCIVGEPQSEANVLS